MKEYLRHTGADFYRIYGSKSWFWAYDNTPVLDQGLVNELEQEALKQWKST